MYLHCKFGFVEADAWDGTPVPDPEHERELRAVGTPRVIVARSRRRDTLERLLELVDQVRDIAILQSPPTWDYEWRAYLSVAEWAEVLTYVAFNLDYRNFKSWCSKNAPIDDVRLAHGIWHEAHDALKPVVPPAFAAPIATLRGEMQHDFDHAAGVPSDWTASADYAPDEDGAIGYIGDD
jgi:hypothetical protein